MRQEVRETEVKKFMARLELRVDDQRLEALQKTLPPKEFQKLLDRLCDLYQEKSRTVSSYRETVGSAPSDDLKAIEFFDEMEGAIYDIDELFRQKASEILDAAVAA